MTSTLTEKLTIRKSTTFYEDFIKEVHKCIDDKGGAERLTSSRSQLNLELSHRRDSIETLSHASHHSNDFKNQQLRHRFAELEMRNLKTKQRFSEHLLEMKITNAEEAAKLTQEL